MLQLPFPLLSLPLFSRVKGRYLGRCALLCLFPLIISHYGLPPTSLISSSLLFSSPLTPSPPSLHLQTPTQQRLSLAQSLLAAVRTRDLSLESGSVEALQILFDESAALDEVRTALHTVQTVTYFIVAYCVPLFDQLYIRLL